MARKAVPLQEHQLGSHGDPHGQAAGGGVSVRGQNPVAIAVKYPQAAYHDFSTLLQAEWQYMSRAVPGLEDHLQPIKDAI